MQDIGKSLLDPTVRTLARATNVTRVNPDAKLLACLFRDCILFVREDRDVKSGRNYRVYHGVRGPHPTPPPPYPLPSSPRVIPGGKRLTWWGRAPVCSPFH